METCVFIRMCSALYTKLCAITQTNAVLRKQVHYWWHYRTKLNLARADSAVCKYSYTYAYMYVHVKCMRSNSQMGVEK